MGMGLVEVSHPEVSRGDVNLLHGLAQARLWRQLTPSPRDVALVQLPLLSNSRSSQPPCIWTLNFDWPEKWGH